MDIMGVLILLFFGTTFRDDDDNDDDHDHDHDHDRHRHHHHHHHHHVCDTLAAAWLQSAEGR